MSVYFYNLVAPGNREVAGFENLVAPGNCEAPGFENSVAVVLNFFRCHLKCDLESSPHPTKIPFDYQCVKCRV